MAQVVVLTSADAADGFRLAGARAVVAAPGRDAAAALAGLLDARDVALVLVTADLWAGLGERAQAVAERAGRPLVVPVPAGEPAGARDRRAILRETIRRAIGYRVELGLAGAPR